MENVAHETEKAISGAIKIDEKEIQDHIDGLVRQSVEDTLNALLNAEADAICNAGRYQRTPDRLDTRAGSCHRKLLTKAGEVDLKVPRLRSLPFETEIIRRYQTKQSSVEEALIEMYLAGVSVRRVEDITEALWGAKVSPSTVSDLNQKIYGKIEEWRMRPINEEHPYVFVDGVYLKRSWGGEVQNVSVLVAVGVNQDGYREILGVAEGSREDKESWSNFLRYLKDRWLKGIPGGVVRSVSAYRTRWKTLVLTTLFSALILHPLLFGALYFPLYGAMREPPPTDVTLAASAYGSLASAIPVTPGGLGTRDAVVKTLLSAWRIPENSAVTAMMIYTALLLLTNLLGGIAFLLPAELRRKE